MNYKEFFVLLNTLPKGSADLKEELVHQFTGGRTTSLKEMTIEEYKFMCASMRASSEGSMNQESFRIVIKRRRSAVLHRLQKLGIDTTDWGKVDSFCLNSKIAGKRFAQLSLEELSDLIPKLESILAKKAENKRESNPTIIVTYKKR